ncbi:MAG TPA: GNAT family N-acetyltransferase [Clostridiales bacterium]|nr:GNAT family N-acetyltransferase [Clostridiales bacterium]
MKAAKVTLQREVYRDDAQKIADWLEDEDIRRYLNEHQNVSQSIRHILTRVQMPILTHLFNQNGTFFIIHEGQRSPIGFLRLVFKDDEAEMVVVIGDKKKWGFGYGTDAVKQALHHAFFQWRVKKVVAKINMLNHRSIRAFQKAGFRHEKNLIKEYQYSITMKEFIKKAA